MEHIGFSDILIWAIFLRKMGGWGRPSGKCGSGEKMRTIKLLVAVCIALAPTAALADDGQKGWDALMSIFSRPEMPKDKDKCDIAVTLNYDKYVQRMGDIRDAWLYKDNSVEYYQRRSYQILTIIARKEATVLTQALFGPQATTSISFCRFRLFASDQDKFGNEKPFVLVSWNFNNTLGQKVHWDKLDDQKFPALAVDFKYGQEFERRMKLEPQ
jgi:hypothetical protein